MIRPEGSWVAIVTPFTDDDEVDYKGFERIVDFQAQNGTDGLLLMGSTGEPTGLSMAERREIVERVVPYCKGKVPMFVGTTCGSTKETIALTKYAEANGADGIMLVPPPYSSPPQDALYDHFARVAESTSLPIALYNNPARVSVNIDPSTMAMLSDLPNIVADKEAVPNVSQLVDVMKGTRGRMKVLCCDSPSYALIMPTLALGGHGTANVSGNIIPREMASLSKPWTSYEDVTAARNLYFEILPILQAMYSAVNPVAVKAAMRLIGLPAGRCRGPLGDLNPSRLAALERLLAEHKVRSRYGL